MKKHNEEGEVQLVYEMSDLILWHAWQTGVGLVLLRFYYETWSGL